MNASHSGIGSIALDASMEVHGLDELPPAVTVVVAYALFGFAPEPPEEPEVGEGAPAPLPPRAREV